MYKFTTQKIIFNKGITKVNYEERERKKEKKVDVRTKQKDFFSMEHYALIISVCESVNDRKVSREKKNLFIFFCFIKFFCASSLTKLYRIHEM